MARMGTLIILCSHERRAGDEMAGKKRIGDEKEKNEREKDGNINQRARKVKYIGQLHNGKKK